MFVFGTRKYWSCFYVLVGFFLLFNFTSCTSSKSHTYKSKYSTSKKRNNTSNKSKTSGYVVSTKKKSTNSTYKKPPSNSGSMVSSERQELVQFAMKFDGTKYKYSGKSPDSGFDCSGFATYVFNNKGVAISGPSHHLAQMGKEKRMSQLMPGDLVFFGKNNKISHVAIVTENRDNQIYVVHATTSSGVKIDNISTSGYWSSLFLFGRDILED